MQFLIESMGSGGYWLLFAILVVGIRFLSKDFSPKLKGWFGEFFVHKYLGVFAEQAAPPLSDLLLPDERGSTQIDHVLICSRGVFVVETKNYQGAIYGRAGDKTWTQSFGRGRTYKFQNPLRQNHRHVLAVAQTLGMKEDQIHSIIAFGGLAKFPKGRPENVIRMGALKDHLRAEPDKQLSPQEIRGKWRKLSKADLSADPVARKEHLDSVRAPRAGQPHSGRRPGRRPSQRPGRRPSQRSKT